ncbi:MAG TPA: tripartite tricarboxylate transporter substrate binding protein [Xanthobacteraceae bacterium]|jgi:tripartite-type tricarboxylate transporter receptor subunit TctC|nr:tripartite tricarboxylate transporter substrate binding protein [Xanthobacteraceae bacterium]
MKRREFVRLAAGAMALPALSRIASAETYPSRPVRVIVGTPPGGGMDIAGRVIAQGLTEQFRQQFFVEDKPGAGTNLATEIVIRSAPDGYMLLLVSAANAINATLYPNLNFNFIRDMAPVATVAQVPQVMEVNPLVPAATVPEFIAYAKANPNKINMASAGNGSVQHVAGELFKMMTGVEMVHVPYKGAGPALVDLLGGQMQAMFDTTPGSIAHIKAGKLRALAVTSKTRAEALPDLPTVGDFIPGYEASQWYGLAAPKDTPADVIATLNKAVNAALAELAMKAKLAELGGAPFPGTPAEFGALIVAETEKWAKVVKFSGAKVD